MNEKIRAHIIVSGLVQMVFFRVNTAEKARELGVTGWVRNRPGGQVEAVFEGEKDNIEKIVEWAKKGPPIAKVNGINVEWQEYSGEFKNFKIKY